MTHRNANNMLSVLVIVLAVFIVLSPFLPQLDFFMNGPSTVKSPTYVSEAARTTYATSGDPDGGGGDPSKDAAAKQLYIPSIGALAPIIEGTAQNTVDKGLWHRPLSAKPGIAGNTVIVGHRFSYNPGVEQPFYHLDKVKIGDSIYIRWNNTTYHYVVAEKKVVTPKQVEVEAQTADTRLTLYTCTPLVNPVNRLVIIAKPYGANNE